MNPIDVLFGVLMGLSLLVIGYGVGVLMMCRRVIRILDEHDAEAEAYAVPVFGGVTVENGVTLHRGKPMGKDGAK
jgi:hypothetical protein